MNAEYFFGSSFIPHPSSLLLAASNDLLERANHYERTIVRIIRGKLMGHCRATNKPE
jgi:hypothetical protein